jgi:exonuclease III
MTYSTDNSVDNIDILNLMSPPSSLRSGKLQELCEEFRLSDPYRALYPLRRDYTYVPRSGGNNWSRLDFFIISDVLVSSVDECNIKPSFFNKIV